MNLQALRTGMLRLAWGCVSGLPIIMVAGCGPVHLVAATAIPVPLIAKIPIGVALLIPPQFSQYVHREERGGTNWHVEIGHAQAEGMQRLLQAMFEHVVLVDSLNAAVDLDAHIRMILEPEVEEYAFVTPRDAGSPFFAVSIKYRVNIYLPDGRLTDSWRFTGYGSAPARGLSSGAPLAAATSLAMRDAGAKLAVEFREQAVVRGLSSSPESASGPSGDSIEPPAAPDGMPESGSAAAAGLEPLALRVRNTSRLVMPVVSTGSPSMNLGRKREPLMACSASDTCRVDALQSITSASVTTPSRVTVNSICTKVSSA